MSEGTMSEPEKVTETWIYGGIRVTRSNKQAYLWIDETGRHLVFNKVRASAVGSMYTVTVYRESKDVTVFGVPGYTGLRATDETRLEMQTADTAARTQLELLRLMYGRSDAKQNTLDEVLEPLLVLAKTLRTGTARDAFAMYVVRKINTAW